jgi:hypothetical protein
MKFSLLLLSVNLRAQGLVEMPLTHTSQAGQLSLGSVVERHKLSFSYMAPWQWKSVAEGFRKMNSIGSLHAEDKMYTCHRIPLVAHC